MADDADRTERATPKKREQARERGQVPRSAEIGPVVQLLALVVLASAGAPMALARGRELVRAWLAAAGPLVAGHGPALAGVMPLATRSMMEMGAIVLPVLFTGAAIGVGTGLAQTGWNPNASHLVPDLTRLSPAAGLRRVFSGDGVMNLPRGLLKMTVMLVIAYRVLLDVGAQAVAAPDMTPDELMVFIAVGLRRLVLRLVLGLGLVGGLDYVWQRWRYEKNLRMSKQEVKDEGREQDGDPKIKARFRKSHRELAKRRMLVEVPHADVVLVNPIHVAVALRYRAVEMRAPVVIAKGAGELCEKIKEAARRAGVPIVERRALARALFRSVKLGAEIPPALYRAVAEILAYIFSLKNLRAAEAH